MPVRLIQPWSKLRITWDCEEPVDNELSYYTDGSKQNERVGCAYVLVAGERELACQIFRLGDWATVFEAELYAIYRAAQHAHLNMVYGASLYSDSMSVLHRLGSYCHDDHLIEMAKELILRTRMKVHWVKAHMDWRWNEVVDQMAKFGTKQTDVDEEFLLGRTQIKNMCRDEVNKTWQNTWTNEHRGRILYRLLPEVSQDRVYGDFYLNQLLTEHGWSDAYKKRVFQDCDVCRFCRNEIGTFEHYVFSCTNFANIREHLRNFTPPVKLSYIKTVKVRKVIIEIIRRVVSDRDD